MKFELKFNTFSPKRLAYLTRNRLYEDGPAYLIGFGIFAGLNALGLLVSRRFMSSTAMSQHMTAQGAVLPDGWDFIIVLAGLLFAAQAFRAMHSGKSGTEWLLLPATSLEKYTAALAEYLVVYPVVTALLSLALSALLNAIQIALGSPAGIIFNPFQLGVLKAWGQYCVAALIFLAGAAFFRKRAFLKVAGCGIALAFAVSVILVTVMGFVAHGGHATPEGFSALNGFISINGDGFSIGGKKSLDPGVTQFITALAYAFVYAVLPLFSLAFGYFRVHEKEARDEVQ